MFEQTSASTSALSLVVRIAAPEEILVVVAADGHVEGHRVPDLDGLVDSREPGVASSSMTATDSSYDGPEHARWEPKSYAL